MTTKAILVAGVMVAACVAACVPARTKITSNRSPELTAPVTEMFVVSEVGSEGEASKDLFAKELVETGRRCGIRLGVSHVSKLDLDPQVHAQRAQAFGSPNLLIVKLTGGTKQGEVIVGTDYDAKLFDEASNKILWRADLRLTLGARAAGDPGTILAKDLLRQLNTDKITPRCASLIKQTVGDPGSKPR